MISRMLMMAAANAGGSPPVGSGQAIFGYGYNAGPVSLTNLVNNIGVVSSDVSGVGTGRYYLAAASFGG